ncbi:MAG TPA: NAD(P)H-binding protein, partial [Trebonia sp.]|nr:NAD(P)H-binding protein [Trebonia sp.]
KRPLRRHYGMKAAIVGGTGTLGRQVASELRARDHDVRILSRNAPEYRVNLATGEGLDTALAGCEVVIDASNNSSKTAATTLVEGSRRLLSAAVMAGVAHHVCVSVVGCERVPVGYFQVKAQQEEVVEGGQVPWTIVRATQFHEYAAATLESAARWRVVPVPQVQLQTVSSAEVARVIADVAEHGPRRARVEVAGPEVITARELTATWRRATGRKVAVFPVRLPGKLGRALRGGALTNPRPAVLGTQPFSVWLEATT